MLDLIPVRQAAYKQKRVFFKKGNGYRPPFKRRAVSQLRKNGKRQEIIF